MLIFSQNLGKIEGINARHFQLKKAKDIIEFILVNGNVDTIKPVLIFCQGSAVIPLIIKYPDGYKFIPSLSNFDYKKLSQRYHIVVISIPKTPVEVDINKLDKGFQYVLDTSKIEDFAPGFVENDYLENYVFRANAVVDFLSHQKWVKRDKIIVFGHSQGAKVALGISVLNNKISKIGYFSGNPFGLMSQYIRKFRREADLGKIDKSTAQKSIDEFYEVWTDINRDPESIKRKYGSSNRSWVSFSKLQLDDLLKLKQPIYVTYGTEDPGGSFCDLLPIYFTGSNKNNLTLKPYVGLEHNFFEVDTKGNINYEKSHWQEVIDEFIKWLEN
jgi:pimeloyl-ACP methyl ester carboxylesterase